MKKVLFAFLMCVNFIKAPVRNIDQISEFNQLTDIELSGRLSKKWSQIQSIADDLDQIPADHPCSLPVQERYNIIERLLLENNTEQAREVVITKKRMDDLCFILGEKYNELREILDSNSLFQIRISMNTELQDYIVSYRTYCTIKRNGTTVKLYFMRSQE